jgi:hypothetical protein
MAAQGRTRPVLGEVPARHRPSRERTGQAKAAPPHTGRARPDHGRGAWFPDGRARLPPTPGGPGIPVAARSAPFPAATRALAHRAAVPAGPVPVPGRYLSGRLRPGSSLSGRPRPGSSVPGNSAPDSPAPAAGPGTPVPGTRLAPDAQAPAAARPDPRDPPAPVPVLARSRTARGAGGRRSPWALAPGVAPGAAARGAPGPGAPAAGAGPSGEAGAGQRPASRPLDAARAGRPTRGRRRTACRNVADSRASAACRAPAGSATALAAYPRGAVVRAPCRLRSSGSRGQRGRRQLRDRNPAGRRPVPRRRRCWPGRACLGQARCPHDSPGTSWTHRAALATLDRV